MQVVRDTSRLPAAGPIHLIKRMNIQLPIKFSDAQYPTPSITEFLPVIST